MVQNSSSPPLEVIMEDIGLIASGLPPSPQKDSLTSLIQNLQIRKGWERETLEHLRTLHSELRERCQPVRLCLRRDCTRKEKTGRKKR